MVVVTVHDPIEKKDYTYYMDGRLNKALDRKIKPALHKKDEDRVVVIDGGEGCLCHDMVVQVSRFKLSKEYKIETLYKHFHGLGNKGKFFDLNEPTKVRSFNGREIKLHPIKDVVFSGIKKVYILKLKNGLSIKATIDHEIMTLDGWKQLGKLKIGKDQVMCDILHAESKNRKRIKLYDIQLKVGKNHPYASSTGRAEVHRLIYEARINNLEFTQYLDILLNEPKTCKTLKFIDTTKYEIHHKDGNHYNNSSENLEMMPKQLHRLEHNNYLNFSQGVPKFSEVSSVKYFGEEKTYDIICHEPYKNFVANGIVVHNCGKSVFAMQLGKYVDPTLCLDRICFNAEEFKKAIVGAEKGQCVIFDEAYRGLSSKGALSEVNRMLVTMMMEMRQKNLLVIVVLPTFFLLEKYVALWRASGLFHVYKLRGKKGHWTYYNKRNKQYLYLTGKKEYVYDHVRTSFKGSFLNRYTVDEEKYREKKRLSLKEDEKYIKKPKFHDQRDNLIYFVHKKLKIPMARMPDELKPYNIDLKRSQITNIIAEIKERVPETAKNQLPI